VNGWKKKGQIRDQKGGDFPEKIAGFPSATNGNKIDNCLAGTRN
jgi:hypothetical protein